MIEFRKRERDELLLLLELGGGDHMIFLWR
jgi:hypothetical protein